MIKFLIPLLSFFLGNSKSFFKEPGEALTLQLALKIRSIAILVVVTMASLALSCVGISLLVAKFAQQMDAEGSFFWTPGLSIYLGLTVLAIGTLIYSLNRKTWMTQLGYIQNSASQSPGRQGGGRPLENAVAMLIMDFVEERQKRREKRKSQESTAQNGYRNPDL